MRTEERGKAGRQLVQWPPLAAGAGGSAAAAADGLRSEVAAGRTTTVVPAAGARYEGAAGALGPAPLAAVGRLLVGDSGRITASGCLLLALLLLLLRARLAGGCLDAALVAGLLLLLLLLPARLAEGRLGTAPVAGLLPPLLLLPSRPPLLAPPPGLLPLPPLLLPGGVLLLAAAAAAKPAWPGPPLAARAVLLARSAAAAASAWDAAAAEPNRASPTISQRMVRAAAREATAWPMEMGRRSASARSSGVSVCRGVGGLSRGLCNTPCNALRILWLHAEAVWQCTRRNLKNRGLPAAAACPPAPSPPLPR